MKRASFGRGLAFAALAAAFTIPVQLLGPLYWGYEGSLARYLLALVPIALLASAPDLRIGLRAALLAGLLGAAFNCSDPSLDGALLGSLVVLGIGRGLTFGRAPVARTLSIELGLGVVSLALFAMWSDSRPLGDAFAVWSLWLVQSSFALLQRTPLHGRPVAGDPFEVALAAAERLLQQ